MPSHFGELAHAETAFAEFFFLDFRDADVLGRGFLVELVVNVSLIWVSLEKVCERG